MAKSHERRLKSRAELLAHRKKQEIGFEFPLTATSLGLPGDEVQVAHVRRIRISDQAAINQLPDRLQREVNKGLNYLEEEQQRLADSEGSTETLQDRSRNAARFIPAARAFCLATFIDPPLVATEQELAGNPDAWVVTDIDDADCVDWFFACLNADSEAAKKLKPFRPRTVIDVEAGPVGNSDRAEAAPYPETAQGIEYQSHTILPRG
jgi:hypothetical protein